MGLLESLGSRPKYLTSNYIFSFIARNDDGNLLQPSLLIQATLKVKSKSKSTITAIQS